MERKQIIKLSKKNIETEPLEKAKKILEKNYEISYGKYDKADLQKAINNQTPVFIQNHFLIGFEPDGHFVDSQENRIPIDRMVKAVIVEAEKEVIEENRDRFAIMGKNVWDKDISDYSNIIGPLRVGEIFLPPHSAVFNFLNPGEQEKKDKIASCLDGININTYSHDRYIGNIFHEIGHLFWRDCMTYDEKSTFKRLFENLKPSALYEYQWERSTDEEVFCTIYKWYLRSILINKSFYNILEHEEPEGLRLFQQVLDRIAKDRIVSDIWDMHQSDILDYLNPKLDITSGRRIIKKGLFDRIRDIEVPREVLNDIDKFQNGIEFITLDKAVVPVKNNKILWDKVKQNG